MHQRDSLRLWPIDIDIDIRTNNYGNERILKCLFCNHFMDQIDSLLEKN